MGFRRAAGGNTVPMSSSCFIFRYSNLSCSFLFYSAVLARVNDGCSKSYELELRPCLLSDARDIGDDRRPLRMFLGWLPFSSIFCTLACCSSSSVSLCNLLNDYGDLLLLNSCLDPEPAAAAIGASFFAMAP